MKALDILKAFPDVPLTFKIDSDIWDIKHSRKKIILHMNMNDDQIKLDELNFRFNQIKQGDATSNMLINLFAT